MNRLRSRTFMIFEISEFYHFWCFRLMKIAVIPAILSYRHRVWYHFIAREKLQEILKFRKMGSDFEFAYKIF